MVEGALIHFCQPFFWFSFYIFGIMIAIVYDRLINISNNDKLSLIYGTFLLIIVIMSIDGNIRLKEMPTWEIKFDDPSLMVLGKIALCSFYLFLFGWLAKKSIIFVSFALKVLAKYSFSIFFLHQFMILHLERHPHKSFFSGLNFWQAELAALLIAIATCVICISVAWLLKKISEKYSRMVIGC